ncbi:ankyrin repeat and fibronectin type-III domain-containing protein 1 isoform X2 [Battus philenor]|uniref:ankyrin repeat and fibronectin type-III domain-containing protein 1 isoform X2 n=1 Tax=Battus philenor TaxID=42288 RepID=UPI0035D0E7F7
MNVRGIVDISGLLTWSPKNSIKIKLKQLQYGGLLEGCGGELPSLSACAPLPPHLDKAARRQQKDARAQQDKDTQVNIHLQALFAAVEHGYLDKARNILESTDVDVNSVNPDGLSPLDVAVLANNRQLARMLMEFGAKEGTQFKCPESLGAHLRRLSCEAKSRLHDFGGCNPERDCREDSCTRSSAGGQAGTTGCAGGTGSEKDKQAQHWERRLRTLKRLLLGWQQARLPGGPAPPELEVCGAHAVTVRLRDQRLSTNYTQPGQRDPPIVTKFKVEWSSRADFSNLCGSREVAATANNSGTKVLAAGLTRGRRYFFRASAGNIKGWGPFTISVPRSVVPSSWRDVSSRSTRGASGGAAEALEALANAAAGARQRPVAPPRLPRKKTATIRQLFTAASKFQKNLRRGVYLACIVYHEDKVLVTSEEFLPVIEVDETYPACIYTDFHWLMKVSCSWDEVKSLRSDMEKHTSSSIHFRLKLLTAAAQMQSALCIQDLGQLYHKPLRDAHGTVVVSCVCSVKSPKAVSALNSRWAPVAKLRRRVLSEDNTMGELLMASVHEQIAYHQVSRVQLPRGLYLGYLKLQSSVEVVRIVAPARTPNVPPHTRVRENPHVSAEEWDYLLCQSGKTTTEEQQTINNIAINADEKPSESQEMFLDQIACASRRLFREMDIPIETVNSHRIYDLEVIELNNDVSFIMICPPAEQACSVPGQKEILLQKGDLLSLPIQAFEMIHLQTYHTSILNKYSKLSCVLELDVALAAHSHREAFSCTELQTAKERLTKLEDLQNNLNIVWKAERWLMDLIGFARDKDKAGPSSGILLKHVLDRNPTQCQESHESQVFEKNTNLKVDLLQIPSRDGKITKTSPGRGSWPGPAGNGNHAHLHPEFSKSEQQLSSTPRQTSVSTLNLSTSQFLNPETKYSRKGSGDSQFTQSSLISNNYLSSNSQFDIKSSGSHTSIGSNRLPPSKSEDTLVLQNENVDPKPRPHSINNPSVSTSSSPLLTVKSFYPGSMISVRTIKGNVSESAQSLSSDSESQSSPLSVPLKIRPSPNRTSCNVMTSKSMTNVKSEVDFTDTGQELFHKPNLCIKRQPLLETQEDVECNNKVPKTEEKIERDLDEKPRDEQRTPDQPGILQVFAAYETGLAAGTSLKLHVTPRTSAREVIDLVVKQLNMAAVLKGKAGPVYGPERLQDFCLVAVIGARERCLRDDFRPLQLQNPWRKGRLYVRLKHDVLAALQHSAKQPAFI